MTAYIKHHLVHWTLQVGDGAFWAIHLDSVLFKTLLALLFLFVFIRVARRSTSGVPGKLQCAI
ncbi:MAG: F0F1 ATP synthase subunit A, partial [Xanthomonadales bacterium]|nr:F0F1 ATP synthase subunit A [Xanthomonadales bacterium]